MCASGETTLVAVFFVGIFFVIALAFFAAFIAPTQARDIDE